MPPYGLYSLANTPEELLSRGYGYASNIPMMDLSEAERNILFTQNDPAFGNLNTDVGYFGAPFTGERPFQNALFLRGDRQYGLGFDADLTDPSFGGVSGYKNTDSGIDSLISQIPQQKFQFQTSAFEDDEEGDEEALKEKPSGIARLFELYQKFSPVNFLKQLLPEQDPRAIGIRNFYRPYEGLTSSGSIASGIMKGYNPISGGLFGTPVNYGLAGAMQRRIENILGRRAAQTDASRARVAELRNLQRAEMEDRFDRGESLSSIGKSTFSGPGMAFEKRQGTTTGKGTSEERNYGGR